MKERLPKVIILSCGRSGSTFTQRMINSHNLMNFGHEEILRNGGIGWTIGLSLKMNYNNTGFWEGLDQNTILHQVRHPLKMVRTICTHTHRLREEISQSIGIRGKTDLEFAMKYWLTWNQICQEKAQWTYRVEELTKGSETLQVLLKHLGITENDVLMPPQNTNSRLNRLKKEERTITIEDCKKVSPEITQKIIEQSRTYGYEL